MKKRSTIFIVLALLFSTYQYFSFIGTFWLDDLYSIYFSSSFAFITHDSHLPFYYGVLSFLPATTKVIWVQILNFILFSILFVKIILLKQEDFSLRIGLVLFLLVSPGVLDTFLQVRVYSVLYFLSCWFVLEGCRSRWIPFMGSLLHPLYFPIFLGKLIMDRKDKLHWIQLSLLIAIYSGFYFQGNKWEYARSVVAWLGDKSLTAELNHLFQTLFGEYGSYLVVILSMISVAQIVKKKIQWKESSFYILVFFLCLGGFSFIQQLYLERYFLILWPFFGLLLIRGLIRIKNLSFLTAILLILNLVFGYRLNMLRDDFISSRLQTGHQQVVCSDLKILNALKAMDYTVFICDKKIVKQSKVQLFLFPGGEEKGDKLLQKMQNYQVISVATDSRSGLKVIELSLK